MTLLKLVLQAPVCLYWAGWILCKHGLRDMFDFMQFALFELDKK